MKFQKILGMIREQSNHLSIHGKNLKHFRPHSRWRSKTALKALTILTNGLQPITLNWIFIKSGLPVRNRDMFGFFIQLCIIVWKPRKQNFNGIWPVCSKTFTDVNKSDDHIRHENELSHSRSIYKIQIISPSVLQSKLSN